MTGDVDNGSSAGALTCANCHRALDPTDKFCRECGLPTLHRAQIQRAIPAAPPDTGEFKQLMDVAADPRPFVRNPAGEVAPAEASGEADLTTGSVVRVTNPTQATRMAASTLLMVGLIVVLAVIGVVLLALAFQS